MNYHVVDVDPYGGFIGRASTIEGAQAIAKEYLSHWPDQVIEIRKVEFIERWTIGDYDENQGWEFRKSC